MKVVIAKALHKLFLLVDTVKIRCALVTFKSQYTIAPDFVCGIDTTLYGNGDIEIGKGSYMGRHCMVQAFDGCRVKIGSRCSISSNVRIYTYNNRPEDVIRSIDVVGKSTGSVTIGDGCWIGANVFITEGVTIGHHCVIGAGSVVTRDVPPRSVAVGVPARVIKSFDVQKQEIVRENR